jgi:hypothetical protein
MYRAFFCSQDNVGNWCISQLGWLGEWLWYIYFALMPCILILMFCKTSILFLPILRTVYCRHTHTTKELKFCLIAWSILDLYHCWNSIYIPAGIVVYSDYDIFLGVDFR